MSDTNITDDKYKTIRHQANNELAVILGFAQLLQMKTPKESKESEWIQKILNECEKLKNTISEVR